MVYMSNFSFNKILYSSAEIQCYLNASSRLGVTTNWIFSRPAFLFSVFDFYLRDLYIEGIKLINYFINELID